MNPDHKKHFIMPSLRNMQIYAFNVLPNGRLVYGTLQIGGNCIVFTPLPGLRSTEYAQQLKMKTAGQISLLTDNIEKMGLTDYVRIKKPSKNHILRALGKLSSQFNLDHQVAIPSPSVKPSTKERFLDLNLLDIALEHPNKSGFERLQLLSDEAVD